MPILEVSKKTYNRILEDLRTEEKRKKTLLEFSGIWKEVPDKKVEEIKDRLRKSRDESTERVR